MSNSAIFDNANIPAEWMAKFRENGRIGGLKGDRMKKSRAARAAWAPGGANFHRRKPAKPATTTAEDPLASVRNA